MSNKPYLIAHLVRGQPAFDIAERTPCPECNGSGLFGCDECDGEGYWWIIPTSGHRARPYESWILFDVANITMPVSPPSPWPDHYPLNKAKEPKGSPAKPNDLLASLGLIKPKEPIKRRI